MDMDLNARAAYIRGLMNGMEFDPESKNGKVISAMMDLLEQMAAAVTEQGKSLEQVYDELDAIDEDMDDMDDAIDAILGIDGGDDEDDDDDDDDAFETNYEVTCPNCGTVNIVDEDTLLSSDKLVCAECGASFDIDLVPDDEDEDDADEEDGEEGPASGTEIPIDLS